MADPADTHHSSQEDLHKGDGLFGRVGKVIPYFRNRRNVLLFKLDIMLLLWMFVAGVSELPRSMAKDRKLTTFAVDQRTRSVCNNPSICLRHERRPRSVWQRARELYDILLDRLCDWVDTRPNHPDESPAVSVLAMLRDHMGTASTLVSHRITLSADKYGGTDLVNVGSSLYQPICPPRATQTPPTTH